ncbi:hypothetical protein ACFOLC_15880 [Lysobacter cavernae]|uniref:Uncharacterized protein n=1 Tax=Lysobacter cavernae TaxID=1685901 RepID=A0ABV7RSA9_9GAMM
MADNEDLKELQKLHFESHNKYVYFLLAATGAALGYALQKLDGLPITFWVAPGLFAVFCWLASFYAGCMRITWTHRAMHANFDSLQLQRGIHLRQPDSASETQRVIELRKGHTLENLGRSSFYIKLQFWLLTAGLLAFVVWRILEMLRVKGAP